MKTLRELRNEVAKAQEELKAKEQELERGMRDAVLEGRLAEVIESEWRDVVSEERKRCYCIKCGAFAPMATHAEYCPNCGAKMKNAVYSPQFYKPDPEKPAVKRQSPDSLPIRDMLDGIYTSGMRRTDIAELIGVSAGAIANWHSGNKHPSKKNYDKLLAIFEEIA